MLSVVFVLAATLTLLPLVLFKLDAQAQQALPALGRTPVSTARRGSPPGASGSGGARWSGASPRSCVLLALAAPVLGPQDRDAVDQGPSRGRLARGSATTRSRTRSATAPPARSRSWSTATTPGGRRRPERATRGIAGVHARPMPAADGSAARPHPGRPDRRPVRPRARRRPSTGCAPTCPTSALVGGAAVENLDLKAQLDRSTPLVDRRDPRARLPAAARSHCRRR